MIQPIYVIKLPKDRTVSRKNCFRNTGRRPEWKAPIGTRKIFQKPRINW